MHQENKQITVYTDGSCYSRDRVGGWAWYSPNKMFSEWGYQFDTTISQMELQAVSKALWGAHQLWGPSNLTIYSDSEYVVLGYRDKSRKRNKNIDLWNLIEMNAKRHSCVTLNHIRGHKGNVFNEHVDQMAKKARKEGQKYGNTKG